MAEPAPSRKKAVRRQPADGPRETVESIAIAFVLAFLFKTFQAEAYVIPTGSMAPTLYGRHKDCTCEGCGFRFAVGASSEVDAESGVLHDRIDYVYCTNCGRENNAYDAPVFNGDRILVNKQISQYKRFDVVVFKNPEEGHVNYIKRLVGLPGETLRVRKGDIWARSEAFPDWTIQRKQDPYVQKDIQLTVYDDQYPARPLIELGWPERWAGVSEDASDGSVGGWAEQNSAWSADTDARTYQCDSSTDLQWLRYRHFLPSPSVWPHPESSNPSIPPAEASLIADFCSFNAYRSGIPGRTYWVGDLTINFTADVSTADANSRMVVELVEGPQTFQCEIDLTSGEATLSVIDSASRSEESRRPMASGDSGVIAGDSYEVTFANVDDRLCLWVDNRLIEFDATTEYISSDVPEPGNRDLCPVGIAVSGAKVEISDLFLQRDIYYRNDIVISDIGDDGTVTLSYANGTQQEEVRHAGSLESVLKSPETWRRVYAQETAEQLAKYGKYGEYELADDEYLMFGDNSSMSKDSRLFDYQARPINGVFSHRYAVREQDLIGKALVIFWPHGVPFLNDGKGFALKNHVGDRRANPQDYPSIRVPFYPNLARMKKIR